MSASFQEGVDPEETDGAPPRARRRGTVRGSADYLVKEKELSRTSPRNTRYTSWRPVAPEIGAVRSR
ncbi:hypothetical protein GCM10022214_69450 [Actinomadura miaoliensis]|uniref:Uncharacterized protein n=1 Tax=Actinomadura miaoliensis TaxID=430685 RepID=A0ABP7WT08_9ACTN